MCLKEEGTQIILLMFSDGALLQVEGQLLHMHFDGSFLHQVFISNIKYIFRMNGFLFNCKYFNVLTIYFPLCMFF